MQRRIITYLTVALIVLNLACGGSPITTTSKSSVRLTSLARPSEVPLSRSTSTAKLTVAITSVPPAPTPKIYTTARVIDIVDGDTIVVETGGRHQRIRYVGMDCPELADALGNEATERNRQLVYGQTVRLERDVSETDQYDRLLRYVWIGDEMVNETLVREGLARVKAYRPDMKYHDHLARCQAEAQAAKLGIWSEPIEATTSTPELPPRAQPTWSQFPGGYTCDHCIKGNINDQGERIYHLPGCRDYDRTRIEEGRGERWFSSEIEAQSAGWRRAQDCP